MLSRNEELAMQGGVALASEALAEEAESRLFAAGGGKIVKPV